MSSLQASATCMLAIMAVVTTLLATPLFRLFYLRGQAPVAAPVLDTA